MKKGRFLWSAHRITEKQKAGKARNIKGKRQLKNFSTASKRLVALRSSASVKQNNYTNARIWTPQVFLRSFFLTFQEVTDQRNLTRTARNNPSRFIYPAHIDKCLQYVTNSLKIKVCNINSINLIF